MKTYVLAGGCFWCLDAVFRRLKGIEVSVCGYTGGLAGDANYSSVCTGTTGHAEAVKVTFDESVLPSETLLDIFFLIHNPTTKNRQGADVGPQYRSAMFYADETEKQVFEEAVQRAQAHWDDPIVTEIVPLDTFYEAEANHQDFYTNNPVNGYCNIVISPKITKARQGYAQWFRQENDYE